MRTDYCGLIDKKFLGQTVTVKGWAHRRRDHGGVIFIDLRDREGLVQVVIDPDTPEAFQTADASRNEYVLAITGIVRERPAGTANANLISGEIEILAKDIEVLNTAATPPFQIDEDNLSENVRLTNRVIDLRRPAMQKNLRLRYRVAMGVRNHLDKQGFIDIETPMLTRSTPEGARDYLVPSRVHPGEFFALPQSPQLFKQLLMVGGVEKYFQIARCYRDEDFRADRQPEFTQLDIEMSFVDQEDVITLMESLIVAMWATIGVEVATPLPRMTYADAMAKYGSDKPDLRFGLELVEATEYFKDTPFRVFQAEYVGAVRMPGGASQPRKQLDAWQDWAKQRGARGLAYVLFTEDGTLGGPAAKNLSEAEQAGLAELVGAETGDCVFFAAGSTKESRALLGAARVEIGRRLGYLNPDEFAFTWVVDAPMFEPAADAVASGDVAVGAGAWTAVHHAFTGPKPEFQDTFDTDPGSALAYAYDIVCNGSELGGGSIRIHREDVQKRVFEVMGISDEQADEQFGFLLDAFKFGAPPHGGIALGMDRVLQHLTKTESIREVIAFPKSGNGFDPLTSAPAPITDAQRAEAGVDYEPEDDEA